MAEDQNEDIQRKRIEEMRKLVEDSKHVSEGK